jgi:hypothetical protein
MRVCVKIEIRNINKPAILTRLFDLRLIYYSYAMLNSPIEFNNNNLFYLERQIIGKEK